jgi:hypothetical protein
VSECDQVKIKTLYTYCEQVGRRGKDYETKRNSLNKLLQSTKQDTDRFSQVSSNPALHSLAPNFKPVPKNQLFLLRYLWFFRIRPDNVWAMLQPGRKYFLSIPFYIIIY